MRPVSRTVIQTLPVSIERVFALLTDPSRMAEWLPGCAGTQSDKPLRKGVRFKVRFGQRMTEFEVVDFTPPTTFGWVERTSREPLGHATRVGEQREDPLDRHGEGLNHGSADRAHERGSMVGLGSHSNTVVSTG